MFYSLPTSALCPKVKPWTRGYAFAAALLLILALPNGHVRAAVQIQQLSPSAGAPQPVGTTVIWTASGTDSNSGTLEYRFSVQAPEEAFAVVRDFSPSNSFEWTPGEREGSYNIQVTVRNALTKETAQEAAVYDVSSRVTGESPVVSSTSNPLVALYSAPECAAGSMRVRFWRTGDFSSKTTPWKSCRPGVSMNFYVAGMLAASQYSMRHEVSSDPAAPIDAGPTMSFVTGTPPPGLFPATAVLTAPQSASAQDVLLHSYAAGPLFSATDLSGRLLWYYDRSIWYALRPSEGGTMLVFMGPQTLREIDLAGNTLRETSAKAVSDQLLALGAPAIVSIHHEARRLPDGRTVVLAGTERVMSDVQGPGPVTIVGDMIIVLDQDWQVAWWWNSFDHLDVTRKAILDEKCPALCETTAPVANDWLHSNAVGYSPADGNLLLSIRHQDWIIKIDYRDGSGTGDVLWRLGKDGDFTIDSTDPYPWFSHQHDADFELGGSEVISLFDNGNTRQLFPNATGNSRGQVLNIDEAARTVTLQLNVDLGGYSGALGSAQRLTDGDYHFLAGFMPGNNGQSIEVRPDGTISFNLQTHALTYRSFRMRDLYTPGVYGLAGGGEDQNISFDPVADKTYGDAPFALSATASSGLPVDFQVVSGPATVAGSTLTVTGAGTVIVQADQYGNIRFNEAPSVRQSFTVSKADQTITFTPLEDETFGAADFQLSAAASSNLPVTFAASGDCTVNDSTVHIDGVGSCTVTASQPGDAGYNAAPDVSRTFNIARGAQNIAFGALPDKTYGDDAFNISAAGGASGNAVTFNSTTPAFCSVSGDTVTILAATVLPSDTCTVRASQAGSDNYEAADVERSFRIAKAATTTTVNAGDVIFDDLPHGATAGVTGAGGLSQNLTVTYTGRNGTNYPASPTAPTNAGDYTASATFAGDDNHTGSNGSKDFTIAKAPSTTAVTCAGGNVYTGSSLTPCSASVTGAGSLSQSLTVNYTDNTNAGTASASATFDGDDNHAGSSDSKTFLIAKAATATALSSSANPSSSGQALTLTAAVTSAAGPPTGPVTFRDGGVVVAGCESRALSSGQATCTTSALAAGGHGLTVEYSGSANFAASAGALSGVQVVGSAFEFAQALYAVGERGGSIAVTIRRTGDATQPASVDYSTDDGSVAASSCSTVTGQALERCDYTRASGTLLFAPGETERSFVVLAGDDAFVEGAETTRLRLLNPSGGAVLGARSSATLEITDDATDASGNVIEDDETFVRQHYHDFLNREADADGLKFWTDGIRSCGSDQGCREVKRMHTSAAFFLSIEFQETGFFAYRMHKAAFGDLAGKPVPVALADFLRDTQRLGGGIVVGQGAWQQQLEDSKRAFALEFVARPEFLARYPAQTTAADFVDLLDAGGVLSPNERSALVDELAPNPADAALRASVLRKVADNVAFVQGEKNRAFVLMEYFGYLRRNPNDAPEAGLDYSGYAFWLGKLNQFNGDFVQAEMVKAFISSDEYHKRFGQ
jgi:arylsulfate sulfotransferase